MAASPRLKRLLRVSAEAIRGIQSDYGWADQDCRIFYAFNEEWENLALLAVVREFPCATGLESYVMVREKIRQALLDDTYPGDDELIFHLTLVVRTFAQVEQGGIYAIGDHLEELSALTTPLPTDLRR